MAAMIRISFTVATMTISFTKTRETTIYGDEGNDRIVDSGGYNDLNGGDGNDYISNYDSAKMYGDAGNDTMRGENGSYVMYGGDGNDIIRVFSNGDNSLDGGNDNDTLSYSGAGKATMAGGLGNDTISGGDGNDKIYGNDGDDIIESGSGKDTLDGGFGADTYLYKSITDSLASNRDIIVTFDSGEDKFDFKSLHLDSFIGESAFSGTGEKEIRYTKYDTHDSHTDYMQVQVDADGNGTADMNIRVDQFGDLNTSDFML
ncbi:MAG: calcium-binding protein [Rickettsiales bacterium]